MGGWEAERLVGGNHSWVGGDRKLAGPYYSKGPGGGES